MIPIIAPTIGIFYSFDMIVSLFQKGEVPDTDNPSEIFPITSPTRSYSPSKVERSTLADNRLSDIVSGS